MRLILLLFLLVLLTILASTTIQAEEPAEEPGVEKVVQEMNIPPILISIFKVLPKPSAETMIKTISQIIGIVSETSLKHLDDKKYASSIHERFKEIESEIESNMSQFKYSLQSVANPLKLTPNQTDFFTTLEEKNTRKVAGEKTSIKEVSKSEKSFWEKISEKFFSTTFSSESYHQN